MALRQRASFGAAVSPAKKTSTVTITIPRTKPKTPPKQRSNQPKFIFLNIKKLRLSV